MPPIRRSKRRRVQKQTRNTEVTEERSQHMSGFTDAQLEELKGIIASTIAGSSQEIAGEAARAAVNAFNSQAATVSSQQPSTSADHTDLFELDVITTNNEANATHATYGGPFQEPIPATYIKEIQSGEFFDLSKLLPKNLSSNADGEPLTLSLENSVIKLNKTKPTAITNIEQWTTAFTSYMSVLTQKFPQRSQELLQYLSLVRYAARVHSGLGWAVYDYKFRQKASINKSLVWSNLDNQLWLTIFTVAPSVLKEEYPLFSKGPNSTSAGAANRGTCNSFNFNGACSRNPCRFKHVCNKCGGPHPGSDCRDGRQSRGNGDSRDRESGSGNREQNSSSSRRAK